MQNHPSLSSPHLAGFQLTDRHKNNKTRSKQRQKNQDRTGPKSRSAIRPSQPSKWRKRPEKRAALPSDDQFGTLLQIHEEVAGLTTSAAILQRAISRLLQHNYDGAMLWVYHSDQERLTPGPVIQGRLFKQLDELLPTQGFYFDRRQRESLCMQAIMGRSVEFGHSVEELLSPLCDAGPTKELLSLFNVKGVAALPIWLRGEPYALIATWTRRELNKEDRVWLHHLKTILESNIERRLAEGQVQRLEENGARTKAGLELLFDQAVHPVLLLDQVDGSIVRANSAAASFFKSEPDGLSRLSILDLKIGEGANSAAAMIYRIMETGSIRLTETPFKRLDGRHVFAHVTGTRLEPDANPFSGSEGSGVILLMLRDTTERRVARGAIQQAYDKLNAYVEDLQLSSAEVRRERERAEEANRLKSEFLANISHELRTPMNAIIGFTNRIIKTADDRLTVREHRNLNIVLRNAEQLLAMINDLLDYSKLDADRMEIKPEVFQLEDLIDECVEITDHLIQGGQIEVIVDCPQDFAIESDRDKIRQILLNLLSNAAKFTTEGSIEIITRMVEGETDGDEMVSILVKDTGIGINMENLELIFDSFRQVDGSYSRKEGGTGLGLAISAKLAELLGGRMSVSSILGEGSTFTLFCPFEPPRRLVERGRKLRA